jgi:hypothetical protein
MTARTLSAAGDAADGAECAGAGDAVADGEGRVALADEEGADDVGTGEVLVTPDVTGGDGATVCDGVGRIDVEAAPAAPPAAIRTAITATARTTTAAASATYARRGAHARGRARCRGT